MAQITFGLLTVSDTCFNGSNEDRSGIELRRLITDIKTETGNILKGHISCATTVPDEELMIMKTLIQWCDTIDVNVIFTIGGTGFAARDITPEATQRVIQKNAPGLSVAMTLASLKATPMAMLSRAVCGIRGNTLIINLPGSPKAVKECLGAIAKVIPHAVDLILNVKTRVHETHKNIGERCGQIHLPDYASRLRESPYPMISMDAAEKIINQFAKVGKSTVVKLWEAYGRTITEDIYSYCDLPPFRASIKDGYAVIASDGKGCKRVLAGVVAGSMPSSVRLVSGTCVRVNTGAPIPDEATAVVQVEDTKLVKKSADGKEEEVIEILTDPKFGQDIRPLGSDIKKEDFVLKAHTRIGAVEMGLLAACGCTKVLVTELPTVAVLSTGNELQQAGEPQKPGHVYDSNKITLMMMLKENGYEPEDIGIAVDEEDAMIQALTKALDSVDVLLTTGSVSMGDKDMLKPILCDVFKATIHFGRVNMKPGKPTTFATCEYKGRMKYIVCLPGNPVSAMVTAHLFALPLLRRISGNYSKSVVVRAKLTSSYNLDPRPEYARATLEWNDDISLPKAWSTGNQISSKLLSCKNANALLMLPGRTAERGRLNAGDTVPAMLLGFNQNIC